MHDLDSIEWPFYVQFLIFTVTNRVSAIRLHIYGSAIYRIFLLLARYVPNVAKRRTWQQCIYWGPTDQRPTTDIAFWKISKGHISATDHPIHLIFGSRVRFSRSADRMALLPVGPNPRSRPSSVVYNFEWPYLWNGSSDAIRIGSMVKVGL